MHALKVPSESTVYRKRAPNAKFIVGFRKLRKPKFIEKNQQEIFKQNHPVNEI
jgi:hypothetical protein